MLLPHNLFVITGANRGFGKAIAETIASKSKVKTSIVLVGRDQQQLESIQFNQDNVTKYVIGDVSLNSAPEAEETVINQLDNLLGVIAKPTLKF
jgi:sepiapterin reductase